MEKRKVRIREILDAEGRRAYCVDSYREDCGCWEERLAAVTWRSKKAAIEATKQDARDMGIRYEIVERTNK